MYNEYDWIIPDRLLASRKPRDLAQLVRMRSMGVIAALNLTEHDWPRGWIKGSRMDYLHIPVEDFGIPTPDQAMLAVGFIRDRIEEGAVMVHCFAGLGRTGTIIGIYLVESGMEPDRAVATVRDMRPGSLEVMEQEEFVLSWKRGGA